MAHTPPRGDKVGLDFKSLYTPPEGHKVGLEFASSDGPGGDTQYVFPTSLGQLSVFGTGAILNWQRYITPPGKPSGFAAGAHVVQNSTRYVTASGVAPTNIFGSTVFTLGTTGIFPPSFGPSNAFGTQWVSFAVRYVLPAGKPSGFAAGTHNVQNFHRWIYPPTIPLSEGYGVPFVQKLLREIYPGGIPPLANRFPNTHWVSYYTRYLDLTANRGIPPPPNAVPNTHHIAFEYQFIDLAGRGPNPWAPGTPRIEYAVRTITPPFIGSMVFGTPNIAFIQVLAPVGWESSFISSNHQLDINLQRLFHHSGVADPAGYGDTHVRNQWENIFPTGWLDTEINFPVVYNLDQHIFVSPYMDTNSDPTEWPPYAPYVENQHRYLGAGGWMSSRFSQIGTIIENTAAPIYPEGMDATLWGPETFIAYRDRPVYPDGWDSFYNTQYTVVFNNAAVVAAHGWGSAAFGRPDPVLNLNREVKHVFPYGGETFGLAFIADRVRNIYPSLFYPQPSGFPEVRFNPWPISPPGIPVPNPTAPSVIEHFNILYPRATNVHSVEWVGEPIVENRNKTLAVSPSDQSLYGLARVFNYNTELTIGAGDLSIWGWPHSISYRTKHVNPSPISVPVFTVLHQVRNELPDPPSRQLILPPSLNINFDGTAGIVPAPQVGWRTLYPLGIQPGSVPGPVLKRNTIEPRAIHDPSTVGLPTLIFTQFFYPESLPSPQIPYTDGRPGFEGSSDRNWTKNKTPGYEWPRVGPHTIYAPFGTDKTSQAVANNPPWPEPTYHVIDGLMTAGAGGSRHPFFGAPDVSHFHRTIGPVPRHGVVQDLLDPSSVVSPDASLILKHRWVFPVTLRSQRFGLPVFWGVPQYINFNPNNNGIAPYNKFGTHVVAEPPEFHRTYTWGGWNFTLWGSHRIELFNREVAPTGIPHRGNPQQNLTSPWGTPLVGFPRVYAWGGWDLTLWGTAWVSYKNRTFEFQGWNSLSLEDDWDFTPFPDRMKVRRRNPEGGLPGIPSANAFGAHHVAFSVQIVFARGIYGYNGGDHVVKTTSTILPAGWDSLEVGDIDEWEAGKVKPHGDDLSSMGYPRLLHPLGPSGFNNGVVGTVRVGSVIYLIGLPPIGFDGPSVTDEFGCSTRVVTPLPVLSQQHVPQPVVT